MMIRTSTVRSEELIVGVYLSGGLWLSCLRKSTGGVVPVKRGGLITLTPFSWTVSLSYLVVEIKRLYLSDVFLEIEL